MLITSLIILSLVLVIFRVLRGESIVDIHREIKALRAQDVPHFFLRSLKIVFSFKGPGYKKKQQKMDEAGEETSEEDVA